MKQLTIILLGYLLLVACSDNSDTGYNNFGENGKNGSMSRFTIAGNYLYTVDHEMLSAFDLSNPSKPVFTSRQNLGFDIETIYSMDSLLFIGSQTGMQMFSLNNPQAPVFLGKYEHIQSCDPVVSDGKHAYITLSSDNFACQRGVNLLEITDISDPNHIVVLKSIPMKRPRGLALQDSLLIVCDDGLKVFNKNNSPEITLQSQYLHPNRIDFRDVIVYNNIVMAISDEGLYQFSITPSTLQLKLLSTISTHHSNNH